ncbi:Peptidoglycan hydrolase FlgJ [Caulifigura coniformis]|uniref:Peptidoglycan hydrolase FlgJ n=1 Tax=Caulifigura coniformis TaxID=2527983 RepID=A0A517SJC6_9PLAN|nr:rod-binding protein [Caulifigura coniformis]QDT56233.1 Peptidoglycan hydrolase FlgJ [Caulifigura coniformis]
MNAITSLPSSAESGLLGLDVGNASSGKIEDAAKQVEGLFVSMLLKTMRETMASEMFGGDGADVWGGMFDQSMGEHIVSAGGLGLVEQLQPGRLSVSA